MRKGFLFIIYFLFNISLFAQSADEQIGSYINTSDFFTLDEQYPLLKNDMQSPMLNVFSESLLNAVFNRPEEACKSIETLINDHQSEIGLGNIVAMFSWRNQIKKQQGKYAEAADDTDRFLKSVSSHLDSATLKAFTYASRYYNKLRNIGASQLIRPDQDCVIPIEIDTLKLQEGMKEKSSLMFVPVTINGQKERFIFDTGCPGRLFLSERFAQKHNVRTIVDSIWISGVSTDVGSMGLLDSIRIGNMIYTNVTVTIMPANDAVDTVYQIDAVLGSGIMIAAGEVQIFPKEKKIIFPINKTPLPSTGRNMMSLNEHFFLKTYSGNERLTMHFDIGNASSDLYHIYYNKHKSEVEKDGIKTERRSGGFGGIKSVEVYTLPSFSMRIGNKDFTLKNLDVNPIPVLAKQGNEDGALGMSFISLFDKVTISFDNMFVEVE